ncbi:GTP:AMP phosphotransferase AK3, mitochondrial [Halotydeus destructor]|nr:GTP:AMP phosphotransferase AK3, mitochondrial [Halotydeus destructor]
MKLMPSKAKMKSFNKCSSTAFVLLGFLIGAHVTMVTPSKLYKFVISGAPGCGKGTISSWLVRDFGLKHLSSGDLLRAQVSAQTAEGIEAKEYMDKGEQVPDNLVGKLVFNELRKLNQSWILDGYPRSLNQAIALLEITDITTLIDLQVPYEEIFNRIKGRWIHAPSGRVYNDDFSPPKVPGLDDITGEPLVKRDDDKPEVVKARYDRYVESNQPILDYYQQRGLLVSFSGTSSKQMYVEVSQYMKDLLDN